MLQPNVETTAAIWTFQYSNFKSDIKFLNNKSAKGTFNLYSNANKITELDTSRSIKRKKKMRPDYRKFQSRWLKVLSKLGIYFMSSTFDGNKYVYDFVFAIPSTEPYMRITPHREAMEAIDKAINDAKLPEIILNILGQLKYVAMTYPPEFKSITVDSSGLASLNDVQKSNTEENETMEQPTYRIVNIYKGSIRRAYFDTTHPGDLVDKLKDYGILLGSIIRDQHNPKRYTIMYEVAINGVANRLPDSESLKSYMQYLREGIGAEGVKSEISQIIRSVYSQIAHSTPTMHLVEIDYESRSYKVLDQISKFFKYNSESCVIDMYKTEGKADKVASELETQVENMMNSMGISFGYKPVLLDPPLLPVKQMNEWIEKHTGVSNAGKSCHGFTPVIPDSFYTVPQLSEEDKMNANHIANNLVELGKKHYKPTDTLRVGYELLGEIKRLPMGTTKLEDYIDYLRTIGVHITESKHHTEDGDNFYAVKFKVLVFGKKDKLPTKKRVKKYRKFIDKTFHYMVKLQEQSKQTEIPEEVKTVTPPVYVNSSEKDVEFNGKTWKVTFTTRFDQDNNHYLQELKIYDIDGELRAESNFETPTQYVDCLDAYIKQGLENILTEKGWDVEAFYNWDGNLDK